MAHGFPISDAAVEGFRVIGRRWRVLAGWAGFNLIALVGILAVIAIVAAGVGIASPSQDAGSEIAEAIGGALMGLAVLFVQVVLLTGLYRLMLRPEAPGFLHLRIGLEELRVLAAMVVLVVATAIVVLAAGLVIYLVGGLGGWLAGLLVALVAFTGLLRIVLTPVIAFAEGRIDVAAAWRRTRGQTWRLLGLAVLLPCLILMIATVVWLAVFLVGGLMTGFHDLGLSDAETIAEHPGRYLFQTLAEILLVPFFLAIGQAPWVAVYKTVSEPA